MSSSSSSWVRILSWLGWAANLVGFPGCVRVCSYTSTLGVQVVVRISPLFTVVTVNGVDVYFYRLSGQIDGVGFSPTSDCRSTSTPQSVCPDAIRECSQRPTQSHISSALRC